MAGETEAELRLDDVELAIAQIQAGRPIVVIDGEGREKDGDLVFAAELVTPELVAFMVRHTSGFICVCITDADAHRLDLAPLPRANEDKRGRAYAVSVDARENVSTGISATDRAHTIRLLADPRTRSSDLSRPGHVVLLRAERGGVLSRPGRAEVAMDLAERAGLQPAGVLCEIVSQRDPTQMAQGRELREFCDEHGLAMISIASLVTYRRARESVISRRTQARLPLPQGTFLAIGYHLAVDSREHLALVQGDISSGENVLVRVQSECLTGDLFGSQRCDCRHELDAALSTIGREKRGVVLYMRGNDGPGIGLLRNLAAYQAQDCGSRPANIDPEPCRAVGVRDCETAAQIIADLGIKSMRLLTSNPVKCLGLEGYGLSVNDQIPLSVEVNHDNLRYTLRNKERIGH
jgi:3,4-dihydroxy 2-butanone 4-phosphate synthase/GTP cyclohydrolase II